MLCRFHFIFSVLVSPNILYAQSTPEQIDSISLSIDINRNKECTQACGRNVSRLNCYTP